MLVRVAPRRNPIEDPAKELRALLNEARGTVPPGQVEAFLGCFGKGANIPELFHRSQDVLGGNFEKFIERTLAGSPKPSRRS